VLIQGR